MSFEMGDVESKTSSLGQIIEEPMLVTKGLRFKSLLFNGTIPHNPESSGEPLQGHRGPLVFPFLTIFSKYFYIRVIQA